MDKNGVSGKFDKDDRKSTGGLQDDELQQKLKNALGYKGDKDHDFSEMFIHQLIETIEFVLGTVSNTASYLRLWALSLAHSQLADVIFEKTIKEGLEMNSVLVLFFSQVIFWSFSFGVLLCMDLMEVFLHTLRLHWVEFQNKFFEGQGKRFSPFSVKNTIFKE